MTEIATIVIFLGQCYVHIIVTATVDLLFSLVHFHFRSRGTRGVSPETSIRTGVMLSGEYD